MHSWSNLLSLSNISLHRCLLLASLLSRVSLLACVIVLVLACWMELASARTRERKCELALNLYRITRLFCVELAMFGCSAHAKDLAYQSIIRPCMEYTCVVWNPHTAKDYALLNMVQNLAARWIMKSRWDSVTLQWTKSSRDCVSDLNWPSITTRRIFLTCLFLFNIIHGQAISKLKDHLLPQSDITRSHHLTFQTISSTINSYRYSLLVNGIFLWNKISSHVLEAANSFSEFRRALHR